MIPQQRKIIAKIAKDLAETFSTRPYSYRIQEAEDQDGKKTSVFLRVMFDGPYDSALPRKEITVHSLVTFVGLASRHNLVMTPIRKARNGWDGWLCSWTAENGLVFQAWHATKDLEVVS